MSAELETLKGKIEDRLIEAAARVETDEARYGINFALQIVRDEFGKARRKVSDV